MKCGKCGRLQILSLMFELPEEQRDMVKAGEGCPECDWGRALK